MFRATRITKKAARELIADKNGIIDAALTSGYGWDVFGLAGDSFIAIPPFPPQARCHLYASRGDIDDAIRQMAESTASIEARQWTHILHGRSPDGPSFAELVPGRLATLPNILGLPTAKLDLSLKSIRSVEKAVKRIGFQQCLKETIFPALLAYIGEVMRQQVQGKWQMVPSEQESGIWEPWIEDQLGNRYNPFIPLWDWLAENQRMGHLHSEIGARLTLPDPAV